MSKSPVFPQLDRILREQSEDDQWRRRDYKTGIVWRFIKVDKDKRETPLDEIYPSETTNEVD